MIIGKFKSCADEGDREPESDSQFMMDETDTMRAIAINGDIDTKMSLYTCCALQSYADSKDPVYIYINSPGGCARSGYAIVDQMLLSPFPIYTIVRGLAASMGAIIAAYGTKGNRFITRHSSAMIHSLMVGMSSFDPIENAVDEVEFINKEFQANVVDLSKRMKISKAKLMVLMAQTKWLNPSQAISIGLVDGYWTKTMEKQVTQKKV